jgi:Fe-S-cluster containining protein
MSRKKSKEKNRVFQTLKAAKPKDLDALFEEENERVFSTFDCLTCANCCKTTGPLFTDSDISRISRHLGMKEGAFTEKYLRIDEDDDFVLQSVPCAFLGADNRCSIYDVRPKACREYPHTHQKRQHSILNLTEKNIKICPAAEEIVKNVFSRIEA